MSRNSNSDYLLYNFKKRKKFEELISEQISKEMKWLAKQKVRNKVGFKDTANAKHNLFCLTNLIFTNFRENIRKQEKDTIEDLNLEREY